MKSYTLNNTIPVRSAISDYLTLAKPGIVSLVLVSVLTGLCISSRGLPDPILTFWTLLAVGLATAGSAILNNYIDRDIDMVMERTRSRALAVEAVTPQYTIISGILLVTISVTMLSAFVNFPAAALTASAAFGYVVLYTILLKRRTSFANQIGGIAGALPPVIGYVAVTQTIDLFAVILFAIAAVWQQPHALSIALKYRDQYAAACVPVVPVAKGVSSTKKRIALYTVLLLPVSALPYVYGMAGVFYFAASIIFGITYLAISVRFLLSKRECDMFLFFYSIVYIILLFTGLVLDKI